MYNEAVAVAGALADALGLLEALGEAWEIVVVDNASTDATREQIAPLLGDECVRLLVNDANRGKGFSVRRGVREARGELMVLPCRLQRLVRVAAADVDVIVDVDVVVGSRLAPGADVGRRQPLRRRIVGRAFVALCRRLLGEPTRDLFCGFKLWRADAAHAAYERTHLDGWVFDAETIAMARALGFELRELGIAWADREGSRLSMPAWVIVPRLSATCCARGPMCGARPPTRPCRPSSSSAQPRGAGADGAAARGADRARARAAGGAARPRWITAAADRGADGLARSATRCST